MACRGTVIEGRTDGPFRLTGELIEQDRDAVDRPRALEMRLDLLGRRAVVDVPDEDTSRVDVLSVLAEVVTLLIQTGLHLPQLGGFLFHLGDPALHGLDLLL